MHSLNLFDLQCIADKLASLPGQGNGFFFSAR
jgi:hypothetical protein